MKVHIESLSPVHKKMSFEISADRVQQEIEKAYRSFQHRAQLKGFRPGKVPRPLIERHFSEQVAADVSAALMDESYAQALQDHVLPVVARPQVTPEKLIPGQPFRYSATVEIKPEIVVTDYRGIEVEKRVKTVDEQEVDETLTRIAESYAQLHPITDREQVEQGDMVTVDYAALLNGRPIPGLQNKGRVIEMGRETVLPGFQEPLLSARKGQTVQFSVPLPRQDESSEEPQRLAAFRVTVRDLARKEIPVLDDDFAKDHGECETLIELREKVRRNLQQAADQRAQSLMEEELLTQLLARNPFETPPSFVRGQERRLLVEAGLLRPDEHGDASSVSLPDAVHENVTAQARRQVQTSLLLDALAQQLGLSVSEEELQQRIDTLVESIGVERRPQVEAMYAADENRQALRVRLLHDAAMRALRDAAIVRTVEMGVAGEE
jgi:trigger factor